MFKPEDYFKRGVHEEDMAGKKRKNGAEYLSKEEHHQNQRMLDDEVGRARGPLGGGMYVVSGQFRDITREKLEEFIKKSGGNLGVGVNKKTDYLVVGHILDDGRQPEEGKKYQMAVKLGKKVMNEGEFEKYCKVKF